VRLGQARYRQHRGKLDTCGPEDAVPGKPNRTRLSGAGCVLRNPGCVRESTDSERRWLRAHMHVHEAREPGTECVRDEREMERRDELQQD